MTSDKSTSRAFTFESTCHIRIGVSYPFADNRIPEVRHKLSTGTPDFYYILLPMMLLSCANC